jgi:hypothetical protein
MSKAIIKTIELMGDAVAIGLELSFTKQVLACTVFMLVAFAVVIITSYE